jgi:hypothetical protein
MKLLTFLLIKKIETENKVSSHNNILCILKKINLCFRKISGEFLKLSAGEKKIFFP